MASCDHPESEQLDGPRAGERNCRLCGEIRLIDPAWYGETIDGGYRFAFNQWTVTKPLEEEES